MDAPIARTPLPPLTVDARLVVVARAPRADDYDAVLNVLAEAGVRSVEMTLTTPGTLGRLPRLRETFDGVLELGVGTVTNHDELSRALDDGASYIVTPITNGTLVEQAVAAKVPLIPGGLTPTELFASWSAGAAAVKVFPAGQVGPGYLKNLRGPFPDIRVVPSGGVDLAAAKQWLQAGAVAVSVGSPLLGDAFLGGDAAALRDRAAAFVDACAQGSGL